MTASSAPTSTVSSSWTLISRSLPATGEGISVSTLSVETSSSGSSTATSSPTCLSQRVTVPSVTDSPSAGRVTDVPEPPPDVPACEASASGLVSAEAGAVSCALGAESVCAAGGSVSVSVLRSSPASAVRHGAGARAGLGARVRVDVGPLAAALGGAAGLTLVADGAQLGADLDGLVLVGLDLEQRARDGGGDLGVDLVGGHLEQRLVDGDLVARLLEPAGDGAFGDGLAECGEGD